MNGWGRCWCCGGEYPAEELYADEDDGGDPGLVCDACCTVRGELSGGGDMPDVEPCGALDTDVDVYEAKSAGRTLPGECEVPGFRAPRSHAQDWTR